MLTSRFFGPALVLSGALLLSLPASAQTAPRTKPRAAAAPAPRQVPNTSAAAIAADPLRGKNDNGAGQNEYAAPGEPINPPTRPTADYNGRPVKPKTKSNTTLTQ